MASDKHRYEVPHGDEDVRLLLARAAGQVDDVDLVPAAISGARSRRRRRTAVGTGGAVAAAAIVTAVAVNGLGGGLSTGPLDPAGTTTTAATTAGTREALEANQRLVDAIGNSGMAMDYQPLGSPHEAMAAPLVVVGEVRSVRLAEAGGPDDIPSVLMVVDVTRHLAGDETPGTIEASFSVGGGFSMRQSQLDEVRGPVLLVVGNTEPGAGPEGMPRAYPHVDGAWFDVPTGIDGPYVDYAELQGHWPRVGSVEELADALVDLPAPGTDLPDPADPSVFSQAEEIAVAMEQETWVDSPSCQARLMRTEGEGEDEGRVAWAWVRCTGEAPDGGDPAEAPGLSVPVRFDAEGLHLPGDGSRYETDVRDLFPSDLAERVLGHDETLLPDVVTAAELRTARALTAAAAAAGAAAGAAEGEIDPAVLRLSPSGVRLALGPDVITTRTPAALADPNAWAVDNPDGHFRAREGAFSALETLARHRETSGPDAFRTGAGEHPHCAGPPMEPPAETDGLRHVWIQPAPGTIDSCLRWFTVDLYLDDQGEVRVVSLDLWEP